MIKLLLILAFFICIECTKQVETDPQPPGVSGELPSVPAVACVYPDKGWSPAHESYLRGILKDSSLLALDAGFMAQLCPNYKNLDTADKKIELWVSLFYAIIGAESGYEPLTMYNETGIREGTGKQVIDEVTGMPIVSEGLLQLSYADQNSYPRLRLGCDFDWLGDRQGFKEDYLLFAKLGRQSVISGHRERSMLAPEVQFRCGVHIMETTVAHTKKSEVRDALGSYWSTMRPMGSTFRSEVAPAFKKRMPSCF